MSLRTGWRKRRVASALALLGLWTIAGTAWAVGGAPLSGDWDVRPPRTARYDHEALSAPGERLRLASYNIQDFTDGVGIEETNRTPEQAEAHARAAAALLAEVDADIVILQEVENTAMVELLNGHLPRPYPVTAVTKFGRGWSRADKLNLAVLSRLPIQHLREITFDGLRGSARPPRGLLSFVLDLGEDRRLLVYGVHLKSNYGSAAINVAKRRNAMQILREDAERLVAAQPGARWEIVVAGDMNVDPDVEEFEHDASLQPLSDWVDLWRGLPLEQRTTIPTRYGDPTLEFPPAAFDRFIVSPELTRPPWVALLPGVLTRGVNTADVTALPGVHPDHVSDHHPVYLDLQR